MFSYHYYNNTKIYSLFILKESNVLSTLKFQVGTYEDKYANTLQSRFGSINFFSR